LPKSRRVLDFPVFRASFGVLAVGRLFRATVVTVSTSQKVYIPRVAELQPRVKVEKRRELGNCQFDTRGFARAVREAASGSRIRVRR
jgi:hypothetical protein